MKTIIKTLAALLLLLLGVILALVGFAFGTEYRPGPVEPASVRCDTDIDTGGITAGQPFTVLSWNLQFSGSRRHRFFYDGGDAVSVPAQDVADTVRAISRVLRDAAPDIALLQEIDRDSDRTGRIDQLPPFVRAAGANCAASAPYHKSPFVPSPFGDFLGRVDLELGILVRGPMLHASRLQLPLLDEPRYRQVFNLKRAILFAEVPVAGWDQALAIADTHLSAFSHGDGTLARQVAMLKDWIEDRPQGQPWILAGDFNLLPPGFDKSQLTTEQDLYADTDNPIDQLLPEFTDVLGDQLDPQHRTYLPFGAQKPDRKIDYVFVGGPIQVQQAHVRTQDNQISDHLPVVATLVIGQAPAQQDAGTP
ncbi:MAG: hypothetical protein GXP62_19955 [Oligoflexia bacterium]|nr:hypothetical protein [Oligoflexia bacterium]